MKNPRKFPSEGSLIVTPQEGINRPSSTNLKGYAIWWWCFAGV